MHLVTLDSVRQQNMFAPLLTRGQVGAGVMHAWRHSRLHNRGVFGGVFGKVGAQNRRGLIRGQIFRSRVLMTQAIIMGTLLLLSAQRGICSLVSLLQQISPMRALMYVVQVVALISSLNFQTAPQQP